MISPLDTKGYRDRVQNCYQKNKIYHCTALKQKKDSR